MEKRVKIPLEQSFDKQLLRLIIAYTRVNLMQEIEHSSKTTFFKKIALC